MVTVLRSKMAEKTNFQNILDNILKEAMKINRAKLGNMQIINRAQNSLEIVAQSGFKDDFLEHFKIVTLADGSICGRAMRSQQTVFVEDVIEDEEFFPHLAVVKSAGFRTVISTPLISSRGSLLGMISTHFNLPHRFTKNEVMSFEKFCRGAADTIEEFILN